MAEEERKEVEEAEVETVEEAEAEEEVVEVAKKATRDMDQDEINEEVLGIRKEFKTVLILLIVQGGLRLLGYFLTAFSWIPYVGWIAELLLGLPLLIGSLVVAIIGIIKTIKLLLRTNRFEDPNGYVSNEDKDFVKNTFVFTIIALVVFVIL